ncbi:hypothetical protein MGG_16678 [Pyricularia oryzae 70-15]|uniref:Uncharacterized protein n=4 Tax=Pyricularia oryzae TaxID=318829 RepID=G4N328_PYRO7|nr:uncharacterized protein MGG_16678 [Pyricularia oryzae 70-15]ELQ37161.1 hypothetical protein OOU_Y34scaffold00613g6 [Pyricularia oryzae Y34]KAI7917080.1 hypothetical protein M0657_008278 [Pyricularia oryzae]EHA51787.1 hypothetical protein MGG_16678 [Pyricularia oryzae 70-15]KAI7922429.1 hypothetical protein M9X92_004863 [Pyricularia oryzae]QBZ58195.1 hypothetical protein PoMZ_03139 [Pyricularia oryzae]
MIRMHAGRDPTETSNEPIENRLPAVVGNWNSGMRDNRCLFISLTAPVSAEKSSPSAKPFSESQLR